MNLKVNNKSLKSYRDGKIHVPCHPGDAGYDVEAVSPGVVVGETYINKLYKNILYIEYETNLCIEPSKDDFEDYKFFTYLFPRSSISKYNLHLCNSVGVIDSGYRDTIKIRFKYIPQPENYYLMKDSPNLLLGVDESKIYKKGDKIAQLIFSEHLHPKVFLEKPLSKSKRNKGGFGSTGK